MGRSVDLYYYQASGLLHALGEWSEGDNEQFLREILAECGTFRDDVYIVVDNEFYNDYNPFWALLEVLSAAFPHKKIRKDVYDIFRDGREWGITSADKQDIAGRLGITLEDEE